MNNHVPLLYVFCILAGFALTQVPLSGFMEPVEPLALIVGVFTILLFSSVIIVKGVIALVGKN